MAYELEGSQINTVEGNASFFKVKFARGKIFRGNAITYSVFLMASIPVNQVCQSLSCQPDGQEIEMTVYI